MPLLWEVTNQFNEYFNKYQVLELGIYFSFSFVDYALDIFVLR